MKKSTRREIAKNTLQLLDQGFYKNKEGKTIHFNKIQKQAEKNTLFYKKETLLDLFQKHQNSSSPTPFQTQYEVTNETTMHAIHRLMDEGEDRIFCLNFASAKNPGGGFLGGAEAQEESIARVTGLYNCQISQPRFYESNRQNRSCLYLDQMLYSPAVPIFKDEKGEVLEDIRTVSILTAPAVNAGVVRRRDPDEIAQIEPVMRQRINMVLAVAAEHQYETLILGAWGCGVFQNDPEAVAGYFKEEIEAGFKTTFRRIVFAIYDKREAFIQPFQDNFK